MGALSEVGSKVALDKRARCLAHSLCRAKNQTPERPFDIPSHWLIMPAHIRKRETKSQEVADGRAWRL